ncbi:MAG: hypothetical protein DRJ43_02975, partial [Thermoprotei archaeon]
MGYREPGVAPMAGPFVLGIDAGTGGCKAVAYDLDGRVVAESFVEYPVLHPRVDWAEQDPMDWWNATVKALRNVARRVAIEDIEALAVTSQREAFTPLDAEGRVLANA